MPAELLPQTPNMGVHRPRIDGILITPDILEQGLAGLGASATLDQCDEEFEQ